MAPRGGKREGSGRPKGDPTKAIRVPLVRVPDIKKILENDYALPVFSSKVQAGFPSPADDYIEGYLDLNSKFITHPAATFMLQVTGDSMVDAGISSGDWLLVDKSLAATDGKIVIAAVNGELTVKRLSCKDNCVQLLPANPEFNPIDITDDSEMVIWGVVKLVLHELD